MQISTVRFIVFTFLSVFLLCGGSQAEPVTLHIPLDSSNVVLQNTACRDGKIYLAEKDVAAKTVAADKKHAFTSHQTKTAPRAFDGNADTFWTPQPQEKQNIFLGVDLGRDETIRAVEWDAHTYGEGFPEQYEILTSTQDDDHQGPIKAPPLYHRVKHLKLTGPSGMRQVEKGLVTKNADSHGVRLSFAPRKARQVCLLIHRTHLPIQFPRITRLAVMSPPKAESQGTATITLCPYKVGQWQSMNVHGRGIARTECRWRSDADTKWSSWTDITGSFPGQINQPPAGEVQIRIALGGKKLAGGLTPAITGLRVAMQGQAVGPPQPLSPPDNSNVGNPTPTFLWQPDANANCFPEMRYEVQVSTEETFPSNATTTMTAENTDVATVPLSESLNKEGVYYWRVRCAPGQPGVDTTFSPVQTLTRIPTPEPPWNNSSLGMGMGVTDKPWGVELAKDAGYTWARTDFAWYRAQPTPDPKTWKSRMLDDQIRMAKEAGISVLGALGYTPEWVNPDGPYGMVHHRPDDIRLWIRYVYETAYRYRDGVAAWEVCNEHNHPGFFSGTPADIGDLLKTAYITIKNISPKALVTFGGHAGFSPLYLDAVERHIGKGYWDFLNWHCYPNWPDEWYYKEWVQRVFDYARKHGPDKPIWLTEIGTPWREGTSDDEIAAKLVAYYVANMQTWPGEKPNRIDKTFYFQLIEGHGFGDRKKSVWAIVVDHKDPNRPPDKLPAYHAFKTMAGILDNATWVARDETAGLVIHRFTRKGDSPNVQVIWADAKTQKTRVRIESEGPVMVQDMYGKVIAKGAKGLSQSLEIPRRPFYVLSRQYCSFKIANAKTDTTSKGNTRE